MQIFILNTNFETIAVVDSFISLIWTDRYSECGDFELVLSANSEALTYIQINYYIYLKESEHMMIVEETKLDTDVEDGDKVTITGRSLESILDRRVVWGQTVVSGNLQENIKKLITDAIINPKNESRKISNFKFKDATDTRITSLTFEAQYFGDNLYDAIVAICKYYILGFKIVLNDNNEFVFELYVGNNRSYDQNNFAYVVFSPEYDNLLNSNYVCSVKEWKNVTMVAGSGELTSNRTIVGVGTTTGLDRREMYTDASSISQSTDERTLSDSEYAQQLATKGIQDLIKKVPSTAFEGETDTYGMYTYGVHYNIGDTVQIRNEYGMESKMYISEFIFSEDSDGTKSYPTFISLETLDEGD